MPRDLTPIHPPVPVWSVPQGQGISPIKIIWRRLIKHGVSGFLPVSQLSSNLFTRVTYHRYCLFLLRHQTACMRNQILGRVRVVDQTLDESELSVWIRTWFRMDGWMLTKINIKLSVRKLIFQVLEIVTMCCFFFIRKVAFLINMFATLGVKKRNLRFMNYIFS